jgi:4-amino-4-deoxy-L-arabinose transferase-like glycosyltransferase
MSALRRVCGVDLAVLGLLAALSGTLLLANLGNQYLWQDEAQTALLARSILAHGIPHGREGQNSFSQELGVEIGPDGVWRWHTWLSFYAVAACFALLGESAFAARLPFALLGVATVLATWQLGRELWRDRVAAAAGAGLLALSVPFLLLARQSRWYMLAALLEVGGLVAYARLAPGRRGPTWALGAALVLLFHTHFLYAGVLLSALGLHAELFARERRRALVAAAAGAALFCVPWLLWLAGVRLGTDYVDRLQTPVASLRFAAAYARLLFAIFLAHGFWLLALPLLLLRRLARGERAWTVEPSTWSAAALIALHTAVGVALLAALSPGVYLRYLTPLVPPLFALAGLVVGGLARAWPALGAAAAAAWVLSGPLDAFVYELTHDYDGPIEGIVGFLRHNARPGDTVAIVYEDLPLKFYTPLRVFGGLTGEDLEAARGAEWIILRYDNPAPVCRSTRETLRRFLAEGDYARIVLDAPEIPFENREDVRLHHFRTVEAARRVEIWGRRR